MEWTSHAGNWRIVGELEFILWSLDSCLFLHCSSKMIYA